jgi:hypothetical protein
MFVSKYHFNSYQFRPSPFGVYECQRFAQLRWCIKKVSNSTGRDTAMFHYVIRSESFVVLFCSLILSQMINVYYTYDGHLATR